MTIAEAMKKHPSLCEIFSEFTPEMLSKIQVKTYEPGEYIIKKGSHDNNLFIILEGICNATNRYDVGQHTILYKLTAFDVSGLSELFDENESRATSLIANTSVRALVLPHDLVLESFGKKQIFTVWTIKSILNRLHLSFALNKECSSYPSDLSVITYLLHSYHFYIKNYPPGYTGYVRLDESRQEMAGLMGLNIRTVNRAIKVFKANGCILIDRGKISIDQKGYVILSNLKYELSSQ